MNKVVLELAYENLRSWQTALTERTVTETEFRRVVLGTLADICMALHSDNGEDFWKALARRDQDE